MSEDVVITLSADEALVLADWPARSSEAGATPLPFVDQAEERVLWDLESILESQLVAPFSPHYAELLEAARERVRDGS